MAIQFITTSVLANYISTLSIGSAIGYRISGGGVLGPKPYMQTTSTLDGTVIPYTGLSSQTRILSVVEGSPNGRFEAFTGFAGTKKAITLTNLGNSNMIVNAPVFSNRLTQAKPRYLKLMSPPWNISSGTSRTFLLSYVGLEEGTFYESIFFPTPNANLPYYRHDTQVFSRSGYTFTVSPDSYSTTTFRIGENSTVDYVITPRNFGVDDRDYITPIQANITGSPEWTIDSVSDNRVRLRFNTRGSTTTTATYVSTLTLSVPNDSFTLVNTATHYVNMAQNYNTSTWFSRLSRPDGIVGMRIDYVQSDIGSTSSQRLLTIGVGSGGDGAPLYKDGGSLYFSTDNLAPMEVTAKEKFAYWRTVYQIPLIGTNTSKTYLSGDYRVKSQEPLVRDYDYYYGTGDNQGSMFTIVEDSTGAIRIVINEVRETSGDSIVDGTLDRLETIFYYYVQSDQDLGYRDSPQLGNKLDEFGVIDNNSGTNCHLFLGFDRHNRVEISLVTIPR